MKHGRPQAHLVVRDQVGAPVIYGEWRADGAQVERRVGRGWLVPQGDAAVAAVEFQAEP